MDKQFRVMVFGKAGCQKCKVLQERLDELLVLPEWADFDKVYVDVETEDGLVAFCRAECVNPQRIPAFVVARRDAETGDYAKMPNPAPGMTQPLFKKSKLFTWLGVQTDYSSVGQGVISPKMITAIFDEARKAAVAAV